MGHIWRFRTQGPEYNHEGLADKYNDLINIMTAALELVAAPITVTQPVTFPQRVWAVLSGALVIH